jgi:hypothetical protein
VGDAQPVTGEHDRAVHLAQLAQARSGEVDVEREPAGAQPFDDAIPADDDQPARVAAQDAFEPVPQRGAGRHRGEDAAQRLVVIGGCHVGPFVSRWTDSV